LITVTGSIEEFQLIEMFNSTFDPGVVSNCPTVLDPVNHFTQPPDKLPRASPGSIQFQTTAPPGFLVQPKDTVFYLVSVGSCPAVKVSLLSAMRNFQSFSSSMESLSQPCLELGSVGVWLMQITWQEKFPTNSKKLGVKPVLL